jgi:hypothetical protein
MNKFQKRIADHLEEIKQGKAEAVDLELRARKAQMKADARLAFLAHKASLPSDYKRLKTMIKN